MESPMNKPSPNLKPGGKIRQPFTPDDQLKAAVQAVQERKRPDLNQAHVSNDAQIVRLEHNLGKRLEPLFADAGLDVKKIQQIRTEHHTELRRILEAQKADTAKEFATRAQIVQRAID